MMKVRDKIVGQGTLPTQEILRIGFETLEGLAYLNKNQIVCRNLQAKHMRLNDQGTVKIAHYGL